MEPGQGELKGDPGAPLQQGAFRDDGDNQANRRHYLGFPVTGELAEVFSLGGAGVDNAEQCLLVKAGQVAGKNAVHHDPLSVDVHNVVRLSRSLIQGQGWWSNWLGSPIHCAIAPFLNAS